MDALSVVVDEVSLEGLDGITVPSLWLRLEDRQPRFPLQLDDRTKGFIWRFLVSNSDLSFHELPLERRDVDVYDRFGDIDPETGTETQDRSSDWKKDTYPVHVIPENEGGIQGSCVFFKERKDVTGEVRSRSFTPLMNLEEAVEKYGRKLVVVACQALRFRTLIGTQSDPDIKLSNTSYCVLERVGRARWQGELQRDLHVGLFKVDARKFHYLRKSLVKHDLITMQPYLRRPKTGQQQYTILLLLKRFHVNRRTKSEIMIECMSNFLQKLPAQIATVEMLKEYLNLNDVTLKRLFKYVRGAKMIQFCHYPLEDLDPSAGPCINKKGNKVLVRCVKLIKPYVKKGVACDDEDDDDEEDYSAGASGGDQPSEGRILERDVLSQAYQLILSAGTKGIPQRSIALTMNLTKLQSRMICRKLERDGVIQGFMEDEGRQRTTKFISHKFVGVSDQLQLFAKEQEKNKLLSSAPQVSNAEPATPETPSPPHRNGKTPASKAKRKTSGRKSKDSDEDWEISDSGGRNDGLRGKKGKGRRTTGARRRISADKDEVATKQPTVGGLLTQPAPAECDTLTGRGSVAGVAPDSVSFPAPGGMDEDQAEVEEEQPSCSTHASCLPESEASNSTDNPTNIVLVDSIYKTQRPYETYRLLKRKNLIVEAVQNLKIIDGLFPLQKMIADEEKQDGVSTKCCRKTILRLVHSLSKEGLLKIYSTTVIQDGITKKVDMIVHPSIQPSDERVTQLIEQIRFKISSSYMVARMQREEGAKQKKARRDEDDTDFKPTSVRGLGKSLGFQPKMHRLRILHNFLWYLLYGYSVQDQTTASDSASESAAAEPNHSDPDGTNPDSQAEAGLKETEGSTASNLDETLGDEEELLNDESKSDLSESNMTVYADEHSWRRFIPPVRVHKNYSRGWGMVRDLLLCLPLSIFMQVVQINYKVEGLEEYLSDPVKQHHLLRALPGRMKRQLLYKRKYIHVFHENLQKLTYMGLLQFGPMEKFMEKDQVFVYLKRNATIVDTTSTEPHYWLVAEPPDRPFERRLYMFNTAEDVESYWFDLMCVCLNTPLGVIRSKRTATNDEDAPSFVHERSVFVGMAYLLKGSHEVLDDGSIPGDGKGAGGLDSEFFGHLKRNWFWTNHLLKCKTTQTGSEAPQTKTRLRSLLNNALRVALQAGGSSPHYLTTKRPLLAENVEVSVEPASRNQQVVGGKGQKRRRSKKEVIKPPRKKRKEPKKRTRAHDETDHRALKMMTKQRVYWSVQEDSLMMLCSVASYLLNKKLKRPFIPHCLVRDLLHSEFEISMDKTSLAVGRRSKYILKNPQARLNYRICLAEVYEDKPIMRLLEENKPADPENPEDCAKSFSEYVRLLRQKFSTVMSGQDVIIPDSKQQLFSRFKVSAIDDGTHVPCKDTISCTEDIHAIVLSNLIQSTLAMTNSQMKSSRSFQIFHTYIKYDQELLCQVFIQCRKKRLVNRRRINKSFGPKKNRALPILPMSYQLSQTYFRCFSWRFPYSLCTDSFCFLRTLIASGTGDKTSATTLYHETENRSQNTEEASERKAELARKWKQNGRSSEAPIQPAVTNTDSTKEADDTQKKTEEERLMDSSTSDQQENPGCSLTSASDGSSLGGQTDRQLSKEPSEVSAASVAVPQAPDDPPDVSGMMQFSLDSPGGACVVSLSLMSLGLLNVFVSIPKQIVVVDSSLVDNDVTKSMAALEEEDDDDDEGEECEGRKKLQVTSHQASHTNYLMMQGFCAPGIVKMRNLNINDNIVVESCFVRLQLRDTPAHHSFREEDLPPLDLTKCGPTLLPSALTSYICSPSMSPPSEEQCDAYLIEQRGYTSRDVEACAELRRSLDAAGERGLDARELHEAHAHLQEPQSGCTKSLQQYLKDLQEEGQVVRVGSLGVRWVLMQHAEPWLLTVRSKQPPRPYSTSEKPPFLKNRHNIPFMRKRNSRERHRDADGPPSKKLAADPEDPGTGADPEDPEDPGTGADPEDPGTGADPEDPEDPGTGADPEDPGTGADPEDPEDPGTGADPEAAGASSANTAETGNERKELEQQQEDADEGKQTQPREEEKDEEGQKNSETETKEDKKTERRTRKSSVNDERHKETCPPPAGSGDDEDNMSFISRPWRLVDGKLNRQVCKGMLEAVLYHIMSRPGLTQQTLVEHYKDVLQPVVVLDIVQALVDMGCVMKKSLVKDPKPSLFSRSPPQTGSQTRVKFEEADAVFYEPTVSCCLRACQLLPNERHWNDCIS